MDRASLKFLVWEHAGELKIKLPGGWLDRFVDHLGNRDPIAEFRYQAEQAGWVKHRCGDGTPCGPRCPAVVRCREICGDVCWGECVAPKRRKRSPRKDLAPNHPYGGNRALVAAGRDFVGDWLCDHQSDEDRSEFDGQSEAVDIAWCITGWPYGSVELSCAADYVYDGMMKGLEQRGVR